MVTKVFLQIMVIYLIFYYFINFEFKIRVINFISIIKNLLSYNLV